ncbi:hypothetical protein NECAME_17343 [Necator americanus]|uniref:Uncharacterized protein n=1 Tax=Necator americanus TaxID=51031 RepID=W2TRN1_NECAM|nr:hypothetical protein NECAME_17343 [Necator americanus]ETN83766.1 hypothetical protein NECAME_17343 [Necator americanus]
MRDIWTISTHSINIDVNRRMKDKKVKQRATVDGAGCVMMLKEE